DERVEEAHGDRLDALVPQLLGGAADRVLVERDEHVAGVANPLGHAEPPAARHERPVRRHEDVEHRDVEVAKTAAHLDHVAEVLRRDHPGRRAPPRQQGVDRERRAVDEDLDVAEEGVERLSVVGRRLRERVEESLRRVDRRRRGLELADGAVLVEDEAVGERAADVDRDALHVRLLLTAASISSAPGTNASSSTGLAGTGENGAPTRSTGPSRWSNAASCTDAAISAPAPP